MALKLEIHRIVPQDSPVVQSYCSHTSDVDEDKDPGPGTVDNVASAQPHEGHEGEEVAVVEVTHTVEHPGCVASRAGSRKHVLLTVNTSRYA